MRRMMPPGAVDGMESAESRRRAPSDARVHQEHYTRGEDRGKWCGCCCMYMGGCLDVSDGRRVVWFVCDDDDAEEDDGDDGDDGASHADEAPCGRTPPSTKRARAGDMAQRIGRSGCRLTGKMIGVISRRRESIQSHSMHSTEYNRYAASHDHIDIAR